MCATLAMREAAQEIISVALQQTKARRGAAASAGSKASVSFLLSRLLLAGLFAAGAPASADVREWPFAGAVRSEATAGRAAVSHLGMIPHRSGTSGLVLRAQSGACTASCRNAYNQCRVQTKGHPRCDSQFTACMQNCIPKGR